jgi:hypothetical protein
MSIQGLLLGGLGHTERRLFERWPRAYKVEYNVSCVFFYFGTKRILTLEKNIQLLTIDCLRLKTNFILSLKRKL